jgi:hypothetical protein
MAANPALSEAIAGGAIAVALIDKLISEGILTRQAGLDILGDAQRRLLPFTTSAEATHAARIISGIYQTVSKNNG